MRLLLVLAMAAPFLPGCAEEPAGPRSLPRDPNAPYVISAIDYHFHDAHPTEPLAADREVVVTNQGRNVHNVTFEAIGFTRDIQPGERLSLGRIGDLLEGPGRHALVCLYHLDREMTGTVVRS